MRFGLRLRVKGGERDCSQLHWLLGGLFVERLRWPSERSALGKGNGGEREGFGGEEREEASSLPTLRLPLAAALSKVAAFQGIISWNWL